MINAVVFDLDGTLVDTIIDLANATNEGLKKVGLSARSIDEYKHFVGNGRDKLVERAMGDGFNEKDAELVSETFGSYYAAHCNDNVSAYIGCAEMLKKLSESGIKTAVLSNKPDEFVDEILQNVYPNHIFTAAWGKKACYPTKPNPSALLALLNEIDVKPDECLYIGDSDVDVYTAQNAGVKMIGVEWGFRGRAELVEAGAPFVAETSEQILEYINENR